MDLPQRINPPKPFLLLLLTPPTHQLYAPPPRTSRADMTTVALGTDHVLDYAVLGLETP